MSETIDVHSLYAAHHRFLAHAKRQRLSKGTEKLPDFIGVGAPRCATSSIYKSLSTHPEIYLPPIKELNYLGILDVGLDRDLAAHEYKSFFCECDPMQICGEISPAYLSTSSSLEALVTQAPETKVIVTLRSRFDRFLSQYKYHQPHHGFDCFATYIQKALADYGRGIPEHHNWYAPVKNLRQSLYFDGLTFLNEKLPAKNILVCEFSALKRDYSAEIARIVEFLGVEPIEMAEHQINQSPVSAAGEMELSHDVLISIQDVFRSDEDAVRASFGISVG